MIDRLLINYLDDGLPLQRSKFCLMVVDFSLIRDVYKGSPTAAIAISDFFDSIGALLAGTMLMHNALLVDTNGQPEGSMRRAIFEIALSHNISDRAVEIVYPSSDLEKAPPGSSDAYWVWCLQVLARERLKRAFAISLDSMGTIPLLRRAASTPPVTRSPRRQYQRCRPALVECTKAESIVAVDLVGYTECRRASAGAAIGRGLFEELRSCLHEPPRQSPWHVLSDIYDRRVQQQLELDEILSDMCSLISDCGGRVLRLGVDGGVGNDGPIAVIPNNAVDRYLSRVRLMLDPNTFPFVAAVERDISAATFLGLERRLSEAKNVLGEKVDQS